MTSWRDELPPIPAERIRAAAMREGGRLRERRRERRRRALAIGGVGAIVVAVVVSGVLSEPVPNGDGGDAVGTEAVVADTEAEATTGDSAATGTTAAATEETTGAPGETVAATTSPDYTTLGDAEHDGVRPGLLPVSPAIRVDTNRIWEAPASGRPCGPTAVEVAYDRSATIPDLPTLHWVAGAATGEVPMTIDGDEPTLAQATVGPFPPETLGAGVDHELVIYITIPGDAEPIRARPVVLHDCG